MEVVTGLMEEHDGCVATTMFDRRIIVSFCAPLLTARQVREVKFNFRCWAP